MSDDLIRTQNPKLDFSWQSIYAGIKVGSNALGEHKK
jgi:hypothetical protein